MTKSIFADSTKFGDSFFSGKNLSCAKMTKSVFADLTKFGDSFFSEKLVFCNGTPLQETLTF